MRKLFNLCGTLTVAMLVQASLGGSDVLAAKAKEPAKKGGKTVIAQAMTKTSKQITQPVVDKAKKKPSKKVEVKAATKGAKAKNVPAKTQDTIKVAALLPQKKLIDEVRTLPKKKPALLPASQAKVEKSSDTQAQLDEQKREIGLCVQSFIDLGMQKHAAWISKATGMPVEAMFYGAYRETRVGLNGSKDNIFTFNMVRFKQDVVRHGAEILPELQKHAPESAKLLGALVACGSSVDGQDQFDPKIYKEKRLKAPELPATLMTALYQARKDPLISMALYAYGGMALAADMKPAFPVKAWIMADIAHIKGENGAGPALKNVGYLRFMDRTQRHVMLIAQDEIYHSTRVDCFSWPADLAMTDTLMDKVVERPLVPRFNLRDGRQVWGPRLLSFQKT